MMVSRSYDLNKLEDKEALKQLNITPFEINHCENCPFHKLSEDIIYNPQCYYEENPKSLDIDDFLNYERWVPIWCPLWKKQRNKEVEA
jgi:hypothetical protein